MKKDIFISALSLAGLGALIWAMSPVVTGAVEPWDAESRYYFVSLFIAGVLVGVFHPNNPWAVFLGIVIGQLIYMAVFLATGPLILLGILFLIVYSLLALLGGFLACGLRKFSESAGSGGADGA